MHYGAMQMYLQNPLKAAAYIAKPPNSATLLQLSPLSIAVLRSRPAGPAGLVQQMLQQRCYVPCCWLMSMWHNALSYCTMQVLDDQGNGDLVSLLCGMNWVANNAAALNIKVGSALWHDGSHLRLLCVPHACHSTVSCTCAAGCCVPIMADARAICCCRQSRVCPAIASTTAAA